MGEVIKFSGGANDNSPGENWDTDPTLSGKVVCLACSHEWEAVAPLGTESLECPQCTTFKGVWKSFVNESGPHWTCNCDCQLFRISKSHIYCVNCGTVQEF